LANIPIRIFSFSVIWKSKLFGLERRKERMVLKRENRHGFMLTVVFYVPHATHRNRAKSKEKRVTG